MDRETWLQERRTGIGGSDAAAACDLDPYVSAYELYLDKTGEVPRDMPATERMHFGRILESVIAQEYARRQGVKVRRRNVIMRHPRYSWMLANVDRTVDGQRVIVECKNVGDIAWRHGEWGEDGTDQVPQSYLLQCMHYMITLDYERCDLAALVGGNTLRIYSIHRDAELEQLLIEGEHAFWSRVERREPPAIDYAHRSAIPLLRHLHPGTSGETVTLAPDLAHWHHVRQECLDLIRAYEATRDAITGRMLEAMGDASVGRIDGVPGEYRRKLIKRAAYTVEAAEYIDCRYVKPRKGKDDEQ
jgi:putative phage-type endonuclease